MPIYHFECTKCEHDFEHIQKMSDEPPKCEKCEAPTKKTITKQGLARCTGVGVYNKHRPDTGDWA